ncbi:MAG: RNA-binding S4 domain-containing protein [Paracoccaceae bacterium]
MAARQETTTASGRIRIDKWLWQARFFKTRSLAAATVAGGHLRINGDKTDKPGRAVGPGDVLTFRQAGRVRVVRILDCGLRRGPANEAQRLYSDLDAPEGDPVTRANGLPE